MPSPEDARKRPSARAAKVAVVTLWTICAFVTLPAALAPGFVAHPEAVPYPWDAVVGTWIILAIEAVVLRTILLPARPGLLWMRVLASLVGFGVLLLGVLQLGMTDLPGYTYVPGLFAVLGFLLVLVFGLARAVKLFNQKWFWHRRPPSGSIHG